MGNKNKRGLKADRTPKIVDNENESVESSEWEEVDTSVSSSPRSRDDKSDDRLEDENDSDLQQQHAGQHDSDKNRGHSGDEKNDEAVFEENIEKKLKQKKLKVHQLSLQKTTNFNEILNNRGVIYIARIPPRMTPTKIKTLLSDFGEVTRVFLQEEDPSVRKRRKMNSSSGGGGSKRYVEGWVEMSSKDVAKHVARSLHMTPISNHKRNPHFGDLWTLKYLSKFKWSHLTEKVAYERRVREQKLRLETLQARKESANYKQLVETGKKLDKIEERKRKRVGSDKDRNDNDSNENQDKNHAKRRKHVPGQVQPMDDGANRSTKRPLLNALVK